MLYRGTLGGLWFPVRRDCPEIILPDDTTAAGMTPGIAGAGHSDTFTAWAEICSTTEFGTAPLLLIGGYIMFRAGASFTGVNQTLAVMHRVNINVSNGSAGNESTNIIEELRLGTNGVAQMLSNTDGVSVVTALGATNGFFEFPPKLLAGSTRLSYRNKWLDTNTLGTNAMYGVCYDPTKLVFSNNPIIDFDGLIRGNKSNTNEISDITGVSSGTSSAAYGSYAAVNVNGSATLDADYLVTGAEASDNYSGNKQHTIFDIAVGSSGNEVIQARLGVPGNIFQNGTTWNKFKYPFIARAGEEIRVRCHAVSSSALDYYFALNLTKLGI